MHEMIRHPSTYLSSSVSVGSAAKQLFNGREIVKWVNNSNHARVFGRGETERVKAENIKKINEEEKQQKPENLS